MKSYIKLISAIFTIVLAFAFVYMASSQLAKPAEKVQIVVTNSDIPENTCITESMLTTVYRSADALNTNSVIEANDVVGKYTTTTIYAGDIINIHYVADTSSSFDSYVVSMDNDKLAYSVSVTDNAESVSAHVQKNDIVRIYSYDDELEETIQSALVQYVKVIGVFDTLGNEITGQEPYYEDSKYMPKTITLEVNAKQAELLNEFEQKGGVHFAIVARTSPEIQQKYLDAQATVFEK